MDSRFNNQIIINQTNIRFRGHFIFKIKWLYIESIFYHRFWDTFRLFFYWRIKGFILLCKWVPRWKLCDLHIFFSYVFIWWFIIYNLQTFWSLNWKLWSMMIFLRWIDLNSFYYFQEFFVVQLCISIMVASS